ncbi:hypothetical protein [endosymbiont GvMRE of Glomus versiforme]|uniref:hypothetical protein n=1 Tax=endosymbiont GvMRE of Glomus versiforme TaxID=2039283 RepID=UPI0011C35C3C|nr:hypothetical protein [endosymbiont GvMRE of Glomus versiforme]
MNKFWTKIKALFKPKPKKLPILNTPPKEPEPIKVNYQPNWKKHWKLVNQLEQEIKEKGERRESGK